MTEIRVLLVEDNPADARLVLEMLREARGIRFHTETVARLDEAIERLRSQAPDVLLLDLGLPDAQGLEGLNRVRQEAERVPVVILSGLHDDEVVVRAAEVGAQDYLTKGRFDAEVLVRSMRYAIERKRAESALRESEQRYQSLAEAASDSIIVIDEQARITFANRATERIFGYTQAELLGQAITLLMPEVQRERHRAGFERYQATGHRKLDWDHVEQTGLRKDGQEFPIEISYGEFQREGRRSIVGIVRDTSERKRAEERLRLLGAALEAAANAIVVTDQGGDIVWANPAFTGLTGYALDDCRGRNMRILKSGQHDDAFYADLWRTILSGQVWQREMVNRRKDGTLYVEDQTITPVYCQRHVITHFIDVKIDVTEKRRAEQALKDSEERYRTLAEAAQDDIFILDPEHRIRYVNTCGARRLRRMPAEVVGRRLEELFPPEVAARFCAGADEVFATGRAAFKEDQVAFPDGQVWLSTSLVPLPGREGEIETVMGVSRDITERKRSEEALRASEERYRLLFDRNLAGVYRTRSDGRILECNTAFARIFGCASPGEMQGVSAADLYSSPEERARFLALLRETGTLVNHEWRGRRRDGSAVWLLENAGLVAGEEGEVIEGTLVDVSERRRLEEQLRQAQKMEAVGQLAGGVAHDFNNLLSVIGGYSDLVLRALQPDSPLRRRVEEIQKAGERAATLTRQLLTLSRKEALEPTLVDVAAVVTGIEGMLRRLIPENIQIVTVQPPRAAHVKADRGHIEQVILNLAVNARDAMPAGGRLVIETSLDELDLDFCRGHVGVVPGPYVLLAVSDTGAGMDAETQAHIFEPFFTTKEPGKGTGLGLATVYGIVRQWGGTIWVYSEPGHGTTFKIYLPLAEGVAGAPPPQDAEPATGSETILLVEDEPTLREVASEVLCSFGYTVLEARDGLHALEVLAGHTGPIQLLLTDVVMPGLSGRDLADRLLALCPEARVLFTSGYTGEALGGWAEGALLQKPYSSDALARKVRQSLDAAPRTGAAAPSGAKGADARGQRK